MAGGWSNVEEPHMAGGDRFPGSTLGRGLRGRVDRYTHSLDMCEQGRIFDGMPE